MAMQTITGGLWIPDPLGGVAATQQHSTLHTLTATGHKASMIIQIPKAGNITKIHFRTGATTVGAASRLSARLDTVSLTNGDPAGADYKGSAVGNASAVHTANTWQTITLGTQATAAVKGDIVSATIGYGTFVAADSTVISLVSSTNSTRNSIPYCDAFTAAWVKNTSGWPCCALEYSDGSFGFISKNYPILTFTNTSYNSGTAGTDEYALSFQIPFPATLDGCAMSLACAAGADYEVILYTGTVATYTLAMDGDLSSSTANQWREFNFATPVSIAANTTYRLAVRPTTVNNVQLPIYTVNNNNLFGQMEGGTNFVLGTRLNQGAWASDTTTQRPAIFLRFNQFSDNQGLKVASGLVGGMNG